MFKTLILLLTGTALWVSADLPTGGLKVGDTAPDFRLKNVDGKMVSLKDYKKAKGFIVTFTCNTCPYSVMYEDRLVELNKKMAPKGYPVIAIQPNDPNLSSGDSFPKMQKRAKDKQFDFPYLLDEGQKVFPQYGATRTPHVFLLDKTLKVRYIGAIDDNPQDAGAVTHKYVEEAITALEAGKEPETTTTKAIGCGIKFKKGAL
ncbi:MAG: hypothetical protein RL181_1816 [Bacteroidota bacterium]|jgi:peroxiredoxin